MSRATARRRSSGLPLLVACALLAACDPLNESLGEPGGPVEVAVKFYDAAEAWRCDEVWLSYSAGTRENFLAAAHRYERERDGPPQPDPPQKQYCGWTGHPRKRGTARLVRQEGDEAVVAAEFSVRRPGRRNELLPPPAVLQTEELRLVREGGAWRVELPRLPIGRPDSRLTEVGPVDVFHPARDRLFRDLAYTLEATMASRVPRAALEAALRDPKLWASALPSVHAVQSLEPAGETERVQLSFAEPERSLTVTALRSGGPVDPTVQETVLQWNVEGGNRAPVYFRGSWRLKQHHDGTRLTLLLLVVPKDWPGDLAEGAFSAQRLAQAVLDLEQAALHAAP